MNGGNQFQLRLEQKLFFWHTKYFFVPELTLKQMSRRKIVLGVLFLFLFQVRKKDQG